MSGIAQAVFIVLGTTWLFAIDRLASGRTLTLAHVSGLTLPLTAIAIGWILQGSVWLWWSLYVLLGHVAMWVVLGMTGYAIARYRGVTGAQVGRYIGERHPPVVDGDIPEWLVIAAWMAGYAYRYPLAALNMHVEK